MSMIGLIDMAPWEEVGDSPIQGLQSIREAKTCQSRLSGQRDTDCRDVDGNRCVLWAEGCGFVKHPSD